VTGNLPQEIYSVARRKLRIALWIVLALLVLAIVVLLVLFIASRRVPDFYASALAADPQGQRQASDEMLRRTSELASDVQKAGRWQSLFTEEQINGWLAVDLVENHPDALPPTLEDPRVSITEERITLACRLTRGGFESVVSLEVEPYLPEPNVLALRFRGARAGAVPVPLGELLDKIDEAGARLDLPIRWQQAEGEPVALITIPSTARNRSIRVHIDTLRLGDGEILFGGRTEQREVEK